MAPDGGPFRRLLSFAILAASVCGAARADAHSVAMSQQIGVGQIAAIGGTLTLSPTTETVTGAGLLHVGGPTRRGIILVTRASAVTAIATSSGGVTGTCGGASVPAHLNFDNSGCAVTGTGVCSIYVGAVIDLPNNVPAGVCSFPTLSVNIDFY